MDRIINYVNTYYDNVTLLYSTPGMYLDTLKAQNLTWPVKYDDMFPYADFANDYWTGYFTSRANSKK
jgi:alpha-mannosidase